MTTNQAISENPHCKLGGLSFITAGLSYISLMLILGVVSHGLLPSSGAQLLSFLTAHGSLIETAMIIFIVKDMCILLAFPILAIVLGGMRKPWLWVGTMLASVGVLLDILSGLIVIAFRRFVDSFPAAHPDRSQSLLALAEFVFRYVWRVETPFIVGLLSVAVILFSRDMIAGRFGRVVPWVGIVLGAIGVIGAVVSVIQPVLLLSAWYIAVGVQLVRIR
jgi:hypothetical protein